MLVQIIALDDLCDSIVFNKKFLWRKGCILLIISCWLFQEWIVIMALDLMEVWHSRIFI